MAPEEIPFAAPNSTFGLFCEGSPRKGAGSARDRVGVEFCVSKMTTNKPEYKMDARHDWLGDAAESYVAYCFACEGFEVFGAGKWTADLVIRDAKRNEWWRIEVKSTDRLTPRRYKFKELAKKADIFAQVVFKKGTIVLNLGRLSVEEGCKEFGEVKEGGIRAFLKV